MEEQQKLNKAYTHATHLRNFLKNLFKLAGIILIIGLSGLAIYALVKHSTTWLSYNSVYLITNLYVFEYGLPISVGVCLIGGLIAFICSYLHNFNDNVIPPNYTKRIKKVKSTTLTTSVTTLIISITITIWIYIMNINWSVAHELQFSSFAMMLIIGMAIAVLCCLLFPKTMRRWNII